MKQPTIVLVAITAILSAWSLLSDDKEGWYEWRSKSITNGKPFNQNFEYRVFVKGDTVIREKWFTSPVKKYEWMNKMGVDDTIIIEGENVYEISDGEKYLTFNKRMYDKGELFYVMIKGSFPGMVNLLGYIPYKLDTQVGNSFAFIQRSCLINDRDDWKEEDIKSILIDSSRLITYQDVILMHPILGNMGHSLVEDMIEVDYFTGYPDPTYKRYTSQAEGCDSVLQNLEKQLRL